MKVFIARADRTGYYTDIGRGREASRERQRVETLREIDSSSKIKMD